MQEPAVVLFACVHNAGRSQMAAAWFNRLADPTRATAISAGTAPGPAVHPEVVTVMREVGVDLAQGHPQFLSAALAGTASYLITMGCGDACPVVPGARRDDWLLADPKGQSLAEVRAIRDQVYGRVQDLIEREGWTSPGLGPSPLATTDQILAMVTAFRNGTLRKAGFTHRAHLLTGLWFVEHYPLEEARRLVPEAIRRFNDRVGTAVRPRGGYHETITQFYLTMMARFLRASPSTDWAERAVALFDQFDDRTLPLQYYTEERLWSDEARARWLGGDRRPVDGP